MKKKNRILNILFLILVLGITFYAVFQGQDLKKMIFYIKEADIGYWVVAVICVLAFIGGESVIIFYMMKSIGQNIQLSHCFLYSFVGFFFSCVTPGASGGQPMQLVYMKKDRIPISVGTLVLMIVTITYKLVLVVLGGLIFLFRPSEIMKYLAPVMGWCCLGMVLNIFAVISMFILAFHSTLAKNLVNRFLKVFGKLRIMKNAERIQKRADQSMTQYQDVAYYFRTHKMVVFNVFCITVVQRLFMFFVLYLTYRSFGYSQISLPVVTALQGMIAVAADMLPLPGGIGITEKMFLEMFTPVFQQMTLAVMVVSRGLSYYAELLISALFTVVAYFIIGRKKE